MINVTGLEFMQALVRAMSVSTFQTTLHKYSEYTMMRCYLSSDSKAGYCVQDDGSLVNPFTLIHGRESDLLNHAAMAGAITQLSAVDLIKGRS